ncbi:MAG: SDR family NAD(P)-dependent oxidoreductase [Sulfobacillus thermosulfidooxidans]|uniref:Oxidoreductase n=1 Tax=Sulfobacillus thermotolerans TaxID=338644 RepID=A0ABM6RQE0_9FIRM|nr:SDR family oxidoreductase [Sulfobacillus sp. hq2]AUW93569.1 oxidoreductase [Sulfobacillus thermotolerans]MCY0907094.1 SDR family oxidoreductase [Sulfobacillus thermotolerans]POB10817.1 oxidoreductase [Sulfobacillus sp. hq2]PSR36046.1 MAG: SDR family NAD(P)-dependent oxidoreductase [Sulfobacillus thermosulfidooxidans]
MDKISGKVVVITGASSGIGEATARLLASRGAKVVLAARRVERLKTIVEEILQSGQHAAYTAMDVTNRESVEQGKNAALTQFGRIDVWINNAGLMPLSYLDKLHVEEWERMVDVNIKGVLFGMAAALPVMMEQQSGHIINISSVAGHKVGMGGAVYSGTKFAVRAITEGLRQEVSGRYHIRATIISPGLVETELLTTITDQDALTALSARVPGQPLRSQSIAEAIAYAIEQPESVSVNEIIIRPTEQVN